MAADPFSKALNGVLKAQNPVKYLHRCVDELCGHQVDVELDDMSLAKSCKNLFKHAVGEDMKLSEVTTALKECGCDAKVIEYFGKVVEGRRKEIQNFLKDSASEICPFSLKDFDWSLKTILASNRMSEMNQPVVGLSLSLKKPDGSTAIRHLELTKEVLDNLLVTLAAANKVVRNLDHD
eukprot:CAMPEP_0167741636 /NCGR_PEP_ID=MMETSP0110_2-20121227/970_1 /TAXON_ID=629695 /ORGANISM="Gymnochlora sp., Strain CCMP2014" /LENGTH=178 /DNA_ID=CAMNT_0007625717 /DNA_START=1283 /DNA_END=1819 /DNA_ORIENTATION=-